jgi:hypothetical protein
VTHHIALAHDRGRPHLHPCLLCPKYHWSSRKCSYNNHGIIRCSTYATAVLARAQKVLGNDSVELLGPSTILLKNNFTLQLPIVVRATNQTGELGNANAASHLPAQ